MANKSDPMATELHGTNPQRIVEKILRTKVYAATFWKEKCFGLTAETLVDRAIELEHVGGTYGGVRKPTKFMCLLLKMLQIQPEQEIVVEFVKNEEYKYVRCLGALYLRCTGRPADVYKYLEPLYADYSRIRLRTFEGWTLSHVDSFVDELLTQDYSCDIALPHLPRRWHLERQQLLGPRRNNVAELEGDDDNDDASSSDSSAEAKPAATRGKLVFKKRERSGDNESRAPKQPKGAAEDGAGKDSMDVDATNALRLKLGLKPLK
ncbi:PRP38 family-domain-containing protein [Pelagophyceae sp. CCMP2097]|nr:PRP38 family-domain-containing protein [Pelagophyceae sp. CCMP2097]